MRRPLITSLSLLSLLLLLGTVVMDVRSYKVRDVWDGQRDHAGPAVYSNRGAVAYVRVWRPPEPAEWLGPVRVRVSSIQYSIERHRVWSGPGVTWRERWLATDPQRPSEFNFLYQRLVIVRYWLISFAASVLPAWWFVQYLRFGRRQARARRGLCPNCGYDLRASPQRCPECGTAAAGVAGAGAAGAGAASAAISEAS